VKWLVSQKGPLSTELVTEICMEGPIKIRSNLAGTITVLVNIRTRILLNSSYFTQSIRLTWTIYTALKTDASGTWYILVQITFSFSVQLPL